MLVPILLISLLEIYLEVTTKWCFKYCFLALNLRNIILWDFDFLDKSWNDLYASDFGDYGTIRMPNVKLFRIQLKITDFTKRE